MILNPLQLMYKRTGVQAIRKIGILHLYCTFILKKQMGFEPI